MGEFRFHQKYNMLFVCQKNQCSVNQAVIIFPSYLHCIASNAELWLGFLCCVAANKDRFPSQPPVEDFPQGPLPAQRSNHGIGPCLTTIFQQSLVFSAFKSITIIRFICCKFQCCYVALVIDQIVGLGPDNILYKSLSSAKNCRKKDLFIV